jgi:hypothetical protein
MPIVLSNGMKNKMGAYGLRRFLFVLAFSHLIMPACLAESWPDKTTLTNQTFVLWTLAYPQAVGNLCDIRRSYSQAQIGPLEPETSTWGAPYRSDWAIAVGTPQHLEGGSPQ